jgi:glucosamine kinase
MILIADSGSTKTDWRLVRENGAIDQLKTGGCNPYFNSTGDIIGLIERELIPAFNTEHISDIYFYGAGCSSPDNCSIVGNAFKYVIPNARINIDHDLMAAARSLCGRQPGIAIILGTGSNSCYYNGIEIAHNIPSLGYILGDEGSGSHIGKKVLASYLYDEMPPELSGFFKTKYDLSKEEVLDNVYRKSLPNRFLASFTRFCFHHKSDPFIMNLVADSFRSFFDHHVCRYEGVFDLQVHCTGSVGFYFADILRQVASENGVHLNKVTESPIAGLTLYHLGEL